MSLVNEMALFTAKENAVVIGPQKFRQSDIWTQKPEDLKKIPICKDSFFFFFPVITNKS